MSENIPHCLEKNIFKIAEETLKIVRYKKIGKLKILIWIDFLIITDA
jgi:hypothetical protein